MICVELIHIFFGGILALLVTPLTARQHNFLNTWEVQDFSTEGVGTQPVLLPAFLSQPYGQGNDSTLIIWPRTQEGSCKINLQSWEDTQIEYVSKKYTLDEAE